MELITKFGKYSKKKHIISGECFIVPDMNEVETLFKKYPSAQKQIAEEIERWQEIFLRRPFKEISKKVMIDKVKEMLTFYNTDFSEEPKEENKKEELKLIWQKDLKNYEEKNDGWLIEKIIRKKSINILGGKRSTLKSWLCMNMAYCISRGEPFLEKFTTEKCNVLYLDRENGYSELKLRDRMISNGMKLNEPLNVAFISEEPIKLDSEKNLAVIEKIIQKNAIGLVIIDTYRRFISFDENDAGNVSKLFVDLLKPMCERTGVAILFIHHERKGHNEGDEMDMLRGSSDLANYVDGILQVERKGSWLTLKQTKLRSAKELDPFKIKVETDETDVFRFIHKGKRLTKDMELAQVLIDWFNSNKMSEFTYMAGLRYAESQSFSTSAYKNALILLENMGIIEKAGFRKPYLIKENFKLNQEDFYG